MTPVPVRASSNLGWRHDSTGWRVGDHHYASTVVLYALPVTLTAQPRRGDQETASASNWRPAARPYRACMYPRFGTCAMSSPCGTVAGQTLRMTTAGGWLLRRPVARPHRVERYMTPRLMPGARCLAALFGSLTSCSHGLPGRSAAVLTAGSYMSPRLQRCAGESPARQLDDTTERLAPASSIDHPPVAHQHALRRCTSEPEVGAAPGRRRPSRGQSRTAPPSPAASRLERLLRPVVPARGRTALAPGDPRRARPVKSPPFNSAGVGGTAQPGGVREAQHRETAGPRTCY